MIVQSPLRYQGNKRRLLPRILENVPDVPRAIDAFGGSATVCANLPNLHRIYNELSPTTYNIVHLLANMTPIQLYRKVMNIVVQFGLTRDDKDAYLKFRDHVTANPTPLNVYVIHRFAHNCMIRFGKTNGKFNSDFGKRQIDPDRLLEELTLFHGRMHSVHYFNGSYETVLKTVKKSLGRDTFVYLDPPYYASGAMVYEGGWSPDRERRLLHVLDELDKTGTKFMLSNILKHRDRTNPLLIDWIKQRKHRTIHLDINYSYGRTYDPSDAGTDEVIVMNY